MGVARLLAKGWVVFCLFAGAHALEFAMRRGQNPLDAVTKIGICVLLFAAMGLLFIGGFGASSGNTSIASLRARLRARHLMPGFDALVFIAFVVVSFVVQVYFISAIGGSAIAQAVQKAMYFIVPGLPALVTRLGACAVKDPQIYSLSLACAFAWLLAIIYVASAVSRIGLTAGLLRLERTLRPSAFGPTLLAALYGTVAIVAFQLLYMGSAYGWLACSAFSDIRSALLIGLAPLMLAYLIVAALATLKASGPENRE
jgi:hypothetical protein